MKMLKRFWVCNIIVAAVISVFTAFPGADADTGHLDKEQYKFDESGFIGERVIYEYPQSSLLSGVAVNLRLPENHKLLVKAKPNIKLFTKDEFLGKFDITENISSFMVDQEVLAAKLFAELGIYYCREGDTGICIIKKVLYEIPVKKSTEPQVLELNYNVAESGM